MVHWLEGEGAMALSHGELEARVEEKGREMLRRLIQNHLDLRAWLEPRLEGVVGQDGAVRNRVEAGHSRRLLTKFGEVTVTRLAYRQPGHANLHPADALLNLPIESHSHGLRRVAAIEASRGSFQDAHEAIECATGQRLGKRQVEELARLAAVDFESFYAERERTVADEEDTLVLSCDGKGVVMRPEALRPATAEAAARADPKLQTRLSPGEKRNRKRMAEVGVVYDAIPAPRSPVDVLASSSDRDERTMRPAHGPVAKNKWLVASVAEDAGQVVGRVFEEAERRDPEHRRTWVALVDGNNHQIERIEAEAGSRGVKVHVLVDFIHVLEYLWKAARCFYAEEKDSNAETWVLDRALEVLDGEAGAVADGIRRRAKRERLDAAKRQTAEQSADYLARKAPYLDYATALQRGWPIATGVIEGACRALAV